MRSNSGGRRAKNRLSTPLLPIHLWRIPALCRFAIEIQQDICREALRESCPIHLARWGINFDRVDDGVQKNTYPAIAADNLNISRTHWQGQIVKDIKKGHNNQLTVR